MNEELGFWRKSYWRSALIFFIIGGTLNQSAARAEISGEILPLILQDGANIACVGFLIAGIGRAISNRKKV